MDSQTSGSFEVQMTPQASDAETVGRFSLVKRFEGGLEASSSGEMLAVRTAFEGSAGYVAMERVVGSLDGRTGSFALQHSGTMDRGLPVLSVTVVPDSGTAELDGISGEMSIDASGGQHRYVLRYRLPDSRA